MKLEEQIARIIDPTGWCMKPSAYGLTTEEEMLQRTMVGPVRSIALKKAREIITIVHQQFSTKEG